MKLQWKKLLSFLYLNIFVLYRSNRNLVRWKNGRRRKLKRQEKYIKQELVTRLSLAEHVKPVCHSIQFHSPCHATYYIQYNSTVQLRSTSSKLHSSVQLFFGCWSSCLALYLLYFLFSVFQTRITNNIACEQVNLYGKT